MMGSPSLESGRHYQVFWITRRIAQGPFTTRERTECLRSQGITHVLNVSESPSIVTAEEYGFQAVRDCPVPDFHRLPEAATLAALDAIHKMLGESGSKVFVHCVAGQNRSPTILWLYFVACGMTPDAAKSLIADHTMDAVPGHSQLVDAQLVDVVISHGSQRYLPLPDYEAMIPAY